MSMRILLLLGDTPSARIARAYALKLAREMGVAVTGFTGVDRDQLDTLMPGRIGAAAYRSELDRQLQHQAISQQLLLRDAFERECKDQGVTFEWLSFDGDAESAVLLAVETRDLLVTGHDTVFGGGGLSSVPEALSDLLLLAPRPVVICPDMPAGGGEILVAYDGSPVAMRALQMFTLVGLAKGNSLRVVSIDQDEELAARRTSAAAIYLRGHGYAVETNPITSAVDPAEILRLEVASQKIGTLVMGAYGRRGIRTFLFGSTSRKLIENPPCNLFTYH